MKYEFHISRRARDRYAFDETLFTSDGRIVLANFHAARVFAHHINERRDVVNFPERAISAGDINAIGLIDEILHAMVRLYREQVNPSVMSQALAWLNDRLGPPNVERTLRAFVDEFPPMAVYRGEITAEQYIASTTNGVANREVALEEMVMLWLANSNPAFAPFRELFDATPLERETPYPQVISQLYQFFETQPPPPFAPPIESQGGLGARYRNLMDVLRAPALTAPHSLAAQLELLQRLVGPQLGAVFARYFYRILTSLDLIKEEQKAFQFIGPGGPGPAEVIEFTQLEPEPEQFSPDLEWMPRLVLLAKNTYVWLDQLSRQYGQAITRLDQIPDEELDLLAERGFSGLWLIGLWERSLASETIKQMMGKEDAVASAYSLMSYDIADDLGGYLAYTNLRDRAWQRGIRLSSDMVPNHMGIDSTWVMQHSDWFISLPVPPYPSYTFSGPNLSWDPNVTIRLEDHYWSKTDAAVVFQRIDNNSSDVRYVYHGNDGTTMPWNDTAQLNYLLPEVREAVIQTILHVARMFPVIRFDAAMTLAKRHYQRLWFPAPGSGGAVPSRAEHGMTKEEFEAAIPVEFWREVVDRVAAEAPNTLLLAEAFWLMEGYFVRTLGMHRVYNSAFMNMLRDEDNAKYRQVMKNTLEFDPEVLRRYVNFMNNPDERTAIDQFGKGDKYFGVAIVMSTMPGLPMFGHGQVEGFAEKYGMEFRKPMWQETPDEYLIERHKREIFPLLHKRHIFAGVDNFLLYDFFQPDGTVNEDVFAYSNQAGDERALVIYHNRYADVRGWIKTSASYSVKSPGSEDRHLVQKELGEGLNVTPGNDMFTIFRDQLSGLEYIRPNQDLREKGMYVELGAYHCHVFLDFQEVQDDAWGQYRRLADRLAGRGVPSIEDALRELIFQPVRYPFSQVVNADVFTRLMQSHAPMDATEDVTETAEEPAAEPVAPEVEEMAAETVEPVTTPAILLDEIEAQVIAMLEQMQAAAGGSGDPDQIAAEMRAELEAVLALPQLEARFPSEDSTYQKAARYVQAGLDDNPAAWGGLFGWVFTHSLGKLVTQKGFEGQSRSWMDEWRLGRIIAQALQGMGVSDDEAERVVAAIKIFIAQQSSFDTDATARQRAHQVLQTWLKDREVQQYIQVNRHAGILWYNKEAFERLLWGMMLRTTIRLTADANRPVDEIVQAIVDRYEIIRQLQAAKEASKYQLEKLLDGVGVATGNGQPTTDDRRLMTGDRQPTTDD